MSPLNHPYDTVLLVGLPSIFSTPNDKNAVVVPTPGGIRVVIEFLLYSVAASRRPAVSAAMDLE